MHLRVNPTQVQKEGASQWGQGVGVETGWVTVWAGSHCPELRLGVGAPWRRPLCVGAAVQPAAIHKT